MPQINCKICSAEFYTKPSHQKLGYGKYCSIKCRSESQKKGKFIACNICKKEKWKTPKDIQGSKSGKFFCSKKCQTHWRNRYYKGELHGNWQGGEYIYRRIMLEQDVPQICKKCKIDDTRVLVVHHIDNNRKNNKINNLVWLCFNCHFLIHNKNETI